MNFKYKDCNGNVLPVNCEVGKIVIYGNGKRHAHEETCNLLNKEAE